MESLIQFRGIEKKFGEQVVLNKLNLDIPQGQIVSLIGPSGCGKSTLIKVLTGFIDSDGGNILYKGKDITKNANMLKRIVGYCTQDNSFYPNLTIYENLRYYGRMYGLTNKDMKKRISELLDLMSLRGHEKKLASSISGGMKRRVDFAISLLHDPELLILDEPETGLDPILRENIFELMKTINKTGRTIILISHTLEAVQSYSTDIAVLNKGQVVATFSPKKIPTKYSKKNSVAEAFETIIRK